MSSTGEVGDAPVEWRRVATFGAQRDEQAGWTQRTLERWVESTRRWSSAPSAWLGDAGLGSQVVIETVAAVTERFRGRELEVRTPHGAAQFVLRSVGVEARGSAKPSATAPLTRAAGLVAKSWDVVVPGSGALMEELGSAILLDTSAQFGTEDLRLRIDAHQARVAGVAIAAVGMVVHAPRIEVAPVPTLVTGEIEITLHVEPSEVADWIERSHLRWRVTERGDGLLGLRRVGRPWSTALRVTAKGAAIEIETVRLGVGGVAIPLPRRLRVRRTLAVLSPASKLELVALEADSGGRVRVDLRALGVKEAISVENLRDFVVRGIPKLILSD